MAKAEATLTLKIKQVGQAILDRFVFTIQDVINILGKIPAFVMSAIHAYREQELAVNKLTQAMINQGVFTADLRAEYIKMASALQDVTTFADDQILQAQGIIQSFIGQRKVTEELVKATLDLAAGKRIDLATAAELVGKTIGTETNVLKRQGIEFDATSDKGERMVRVIRAIEGQHHGLAEAQAKGLGSMDQLKNAWSDFLENSGRSLAPFMVELAKATTSVLKFFNSFAGPDTSEMKTEELRANIVRIRKEILDTQDQLADTGFGPTAAGLQAKLSLLNSELEINLQHKNELLNQEKQSSDNIIKVKQDEYDKLTAARFNQQIADQDATLVEQNMKMMNDEQAFAALVQQKDKEIQLEQDFQEKKKLIAARGILVEQQQLAIANRQKLETQKAYADAYLSLATNLSNLAVAISGKQNKALFLLTKAAAIAQAIVSTHVAAANALATPPAPFGIALSKVITAAGYANVGVIAATGLQGLAEGGIVPATPGGQPFILGEGGKDEAVIPLDESGSMGNTTIIFNGPILGDESQAMDFARAIDKNLLKLRQSNQSVAFEDLI